MEIQVIKTKEVDEKEDVSAQQPHISEEETPNTDLVKSERYVNLYYLNRTGVSNPVTNAEYGVKPFRFKEMVKRAIRV
jgi:hypothetical protein